MSVKIRMIRQGRKNNPLYRIIVTDRYAKQGGAYIENLGNYNPKAEPDKKVVVKKERLEHWLKHGAQLSEALERVMKHTGNLSNKK